MAELASLVQRLEVAVGRLESMSGQGGGAGGSAGGAVSAYVEAFDGIVNGSVAQYISLSQKIGGDVLKHAVLTTLMQPVSKAIQQVQAFREQNRTSKQFNHLSAVSESVPALGWVAMVRLGGGGVDKTHVDWVKAYVSIWTEMQDYIKQHHTTGLTWSKSGPMASASAAPPSAPAGGCPPPPPPGPPPPSLDISGSSSGGGGGGDERNALFASINKGADITKGLKHVNDDQKTHKNPGLRSQGAPVRAGPKPFSSSPRPAASAAPTRTLPPVLELEGKKWKVENQEGAEGLVISDTELKQVVYAYKCNKSTLQVKGKINSITIDNCKKMGLVFDDVVGIVEVINCKDVKVQVMGKVPTISINKTDGCHVYLSKDSLKCEIVSAKSSEMNILVPNKDGEFTELPVPEQFKTIWDGQKLVTTATEIAG
eukprot:superscaffoldBa00006385_g21474